MSGTCHLRRSLHHFMKYKTCTQLARELKISAGVISRLAKQRKVEAILVGKTYLVKLTSFHNYLRWNYFPRKQCREKQRSIKTYLNENDAENNQRFL
jgi:capsule polysaccharide export protein KpsC/LpsZ